MLSRICHRDKLKCYPLWCLLQPSISTHPFLWGPEVVIPWLEFGWGLGITIPREREVETATDLLALGEEGGHRKVDPEMDLHGLDPGEEMME